MNFRLICFLLIGLMWFGAGSDSTAQTNLSAAKPVEKIFIVPIKEAIMPPLVYVVRRGVKEAMEANADVLILDMKELLSDLSAHNDRDARGAPTRALEFLA